jgi:hypothetical protein
MKYLVNFLIIFYLTSAYAGNEKSDAEILKEFSDQIHIGKGARLVSQEIKRHVHKPDFKKKINNNISVSNSAVASWANYAESPVSKEGSYHDMETGGSYYIFFKNDFSQDPVWLTIEAYDCVNDIDDDCIYIKDNYDLSYYSEISAWSIKLFETHEITIKGKFENELGVSLTSGETYLSSISTNTVNVY